MDGPDQDRRIRLVVFGLATSGGVTILVYIFWLFYKIATDFTFWRDTIRDHFPAMAGLPTVAAVAFVLVVFLRQTDGPIEFEGLGFKFKGASGQAIMWAVCFLVLVAAIKLLW